MKKAKSKNTKMKLDLLQRMLNENVKQLNKWWQVRSQLQKRSIKKMGENDNQYFYTRKWMSLRISVEYGNNSHFISGADEEKIKKLFIEDKNIVEYIYMDKMEVFKICIEICGG